MSVSICFFDGEFSVKTPEKKDGNKTIQHDRFCHPFTLLIVKTE